MLGQWEECVGCLLEDEKMFYGYTRNRKKEGSQWEEEKSGGLEEDETSLYRYDWRGGNC